MPDLDEIRLWVAQRGVFGPAWMILVAIHDLDPSTGVSASDISKMLQVTHSFVENRSILLERLGLVHRSIASSGEIYLSLSSWAREQVLGLPKGKDL